MTPACWKPWKSSGEGGSYWAVARATSNQQCWIRGLFSEGASSVSPQFFLKDTRDPLQCISDEGPVWHGAGMPHVLTSHHHLCQNICWGHCQANGSQQICQKQVKTEVQLHGSAEGAGDEKEEETTTWEWQRSNFRDTSSHAKSVMTQA